jgi:hypothetical protein
LGTITALGQCSDIGQTRQSAEGSIRHDHGCANERRPLLPSSSWRMLDACQTRRASGNDQGKIVVDSYRIKEKHMKLTTIALASVLASSSSLALAQGAGGAGGAGGGTGGAAATGSAGSSMAGSSGSVGSSTGTGAPGTSGNSSTTGMNNGSSTGRSPTVSTPGGMPSSTPAPGSTINR